MAGNTAFPPQTVSSDPRVVPQPPRLHWAVVLILSILTRSFFSEIWLVVQANWVRKVTGRSQPMTWAIVNLCTLPCLLFSTFLMGLAFAMVGRAIPEAMMTALELTVGVAIFVLYVTAIYRVRAALEAEPIGIPLGGVMTFFFGAVYFQYFLYDYVLPDAADVLGPVPPPPAYVPPVAAGHQTTSLL